mgnify:CR=1 FL=1|tara:strand:- start:1052 stop:1264 length:213 start_codon:yes stop_codon:yes gene_type:complete
MTRNDKEWGTAAYWAQEEAIKHAAAAKASLTSIAPITWVQARGRYFVTVNGTTTSSFHLPTVVAAASFRA